MDVIGRAKQDARAESEAVAETHKCRKRMERKSDLTPFLTTIPASSSESLLSVAEQRFVTNH